MFHELDWISLQDAITECKQSIVTYSTYYSELSFSEAFPQLMEAHLQFGSILINIENITSSFLGMCSIYSPTPAPYPVDLGLSLPNDTDTCYTTTSYNEGVANVTISGSQSSSTFATIYWTLDSNETTFLGYSVIFAVEGDDGGFAEVVVKGGGETLSTLTLDAFPNDVGVYQFEITDCFDT